MSVSEGDFGQLYPYHQAMLFGDGQARAQKGLLNSIMTMLNGRKNGEEGPNPEDIPWGEDLVTDQITQTFYAYNIKAPVYAEEIEWSDKRESTARGPIELALDLVSEEGDIEEGDVIFDFGCGSGRLIDLIKNRFPQAVVRGLDFAEGMVKEARLRLAELDHEGADSLVDVADIRSPSIVPLVRHFTNGSNVRLIACNSALTHVPKSETPNFFDSAAEILDTGGILYIGLKMTDDGSLFSDTKLEMTRWFTTYSPDELRKLDMIAKSRGFRLVTSFALPHHDDDKPKWVELYFVKE